MIASKAVVIRVSFTFLIFIWNNKLAEFAFIRIKVCAHMIFCNAMWQFELDDPGPNIRFDFLFWFDFLAYPIVDF